MPQLMCEPTATLLRAASRWDEEDWLITPKNDSDTVRACRAANTSGDGTAQDKTATGQFFGFVRGNRLIKDILLGLYDQALVGGASTVKTENGVRTGWSPKSVLADLLCTRYEDLWTADKNGKWVLLKADGMTTEQSFDSLNEAVLYLIKRVVRALRAHRTEVL